MKLLLLNIHLEWNHNRLRKLVEKDTREGMDEVFLVMYDYDGYKKQKSLEGAPPVKPQIEIEPMPVPPPNSTNFELSEEEDEDVDDPIWNPKAAASVVARKPAPVVVPKVAAVKPKVELPSYTIPSSSSYTTHSSVSTPSPCLLCKEKSGRELRLVGGRTFEVKPVFLLSQVVIFFFLPGDRALQAVPVQARPTSSHRAPW